MNDLWARWSRHYEALGIAPERIVRDGIADGDRWAAERVRVLFVLKEANDWPGADVRHQLRGRLRFQVWHTLARWAAGLLHGFPDFNEVNHVSAMEGALRRIAVINLKKASGGARSDASVINAYCHQDRDLLREQIAQIRPSIIVACGTFDPLVWLLGCCLDPEHPRDHPASAPELRCSVLPWRHPARCDNRRTYTALKHLAAAV